MQVFDLNIEEVLENWDVFHGIREIIANASDEQIQTDTKNIEIKKEKNKHIIRDFGRGIKIDHFTQNENQEKLSNPKVIGKFGVGLKDALSTFDRYNVEILLKSKYGDFTTKKTSKHGFEEIKTLHVQIDAPSEPDLVGTKVILSNCPDKQMTQAKHLFLRFSNEHKLEETSYGEIYEKDDVAKIYINGGKIAEEENFLFSYNITSPTVKMKKALNRERTNVGRTAYTDRVKAILLETSNNKVVKLLVNDLTLFEKGTQHDEIKWLDVAIHACKILNTSDDVLFVSTKELQLNRSLLDDAQAMGRKLMVLPDNVLEKIRSLKDSQGNSIKDIHIFMKEVSDNFKYDEVLPAMMSKNEKNVYDKTSEILNLVKGGKKSVKSVMISNTMQKDIIGTETLGVYEPFLRRIIIRRDQLCDIETYAGILLHEVCHAIYDVGDVNRDFERSLSKMMGEVVGRYFDKNGGLN